MPVVAVVNRKGGSGKSTLATHLAAYCAHSGIPVMLGDVDRQQSTAAWLRLRTAQATSAAAPIVGWVVDPRSVLRAPSGVTHVILDTPGGLRDFDLARVVMFADAIVMPVCNSVFDRESAADCYAELQTLPRVASGRCQVAAVGMRLDARTKAAEVLKDWADKQQLPFLGVLRETQAYVRCVEQGLTLFDMPPAKVEADMAQWQPILEWLEPVLRPRRDEAAARAPVARVPAETPSLPVTPGPSRPLPATVPVAAAPRAPATGPATVPARSGVPVAQPAFTESSLSATFRAFESAPRPTVGSRVGALLGGLSLSRLLQRN